MFALKNQDHLTDQDGNNSRQEERVLVDEIEKNDLLKEIHAITESAKISSIASASPRIANLVDPIPEELASIANVDGNEDEISVASIISLVERGAGEEEIAAFLDEALKTIAENIGKDKSSSKKHLMQLLNVLTVLERSINQNGKNPELQNSLRQLQDKVSNIAKSNNPELAQQFLKSNDLKAGMKQAFEQNTIQPEALKKAAENVNAMAKDAQQRQAQQQAQQRDSSKQSEVGSNVLSSMISKIRDSLNAARESAGKDSAVNSSKIDSSRIQQSNLAAGQAATQAAAIQNAAQVASRAAQQQNVQQANIQNSQAAIVAANTRTIDAKIPAPQIQNDAVLKSVAVQQKPIQNDANILKLNAQNDAVIKAATSQPKLEQKPLGVPPTKGHVCNGVCCGGANKTQTTQAYAKAAENVARLRQEVSQKIPAEEIKQLDQSVRSNAKQYIQDAQNVKANIGQEAADLLSSVGL